MFVCWADDDQRWPKSPRIQLSIRWPRNRSYTASVTVQPLHYHARKLIFIRQYYPIVICISHYCHVCFQAFFLCIKLTKSYLIVVYPLYSYQLKMLVHVPCYDNIVSIHTYNIIIWWYWIFLLRKHNFDEYYEKICWKFVKMDKLGNP